MIKPLIPSGFFMPQIELYFTTPITPKKNSFKAGRTRDGRLFQYKSQKAKSSQEGLHYEAWIQAKKTKHAIVETPVKAEFYFRKTRADLIGVAETLQDALEDAIYKNDKQIIEQKMKWTENLADGYTAFVRILW